MSKNKKTLDKHTIDAILNVQTTRANMKLSVKQIQELMQYLRNTAEVDPNDEISNAASSLAYRLESAGTSVFDMSPDFTRWTALDQQTAQYAIRKRNTYVLKPGAKHACIV